jgi:hypothetical protein
MPDAELLSFIDRNYREPYALIKNNCIHKSLRIRKKARERGRFVDIMICISVVPVDWLKGLPVPCPHMYTLIDGEKVDVSLDPEHEARYCRNEDKKLLFPVNVSQLLRRITGRARDIPERQMDQDGY